jgi:hypothetical protein
LCPQEREGAREGLVLAPQTLTLLKQIRELSLDILTVTHVVIVTWATAHNWGTFAPTLHGVAG